MKLPRSGARPWPALLVAGAVVVAALLLWGAPTAYFVVAPGKALEARRMVQVQGGQHSGGGRLLVLAAQARPATPVWYLRARLDHRADLQPAARFLHGYDDYAAYQRRLQELMDESRHKAAVAALQQLGLAVEAESAPGRFVLPLAISVEPGSLSGPSAGLAFALEVIDQLSRRRLSEGLVVAVTGSIEPDGRVGAVGAVRQKTLAAEAAGAHLLLVPRANLQEALAAAGQIQVVPVDHLGDAVEFLHQYRQAARP